MRRDCDIDGLTPVDFGPGFSEREALDNVWLTDPRRYQPGRAEIENDKAEPAVTIDRAEE